jgi:hypothetical protein
MRDFRAVRWEDSPMKFRQILVAILTLTTMWHTAAAQPKKKNIETEAPPLQGVLTGTNTQANAILPNLITIKPEMPLGPQDLLKSYEIAMSLLAEKTSTDFVAIVQAQQSNQISREDAEYLLQQRYQTAMMQYQVLSALHDVLKHDMEESAPPAQSSLRTSRSDTVLMVPCPVDASACR